MVTERIGARPGPGGHGGGQARESAYDVVVVGGGMAGLTAGAVLAHAGKKVLVAEEDGEPGGYARALRHGPYTFDRADHLIFGCEETGPLGPGLIDVVLRQLGVRDKCEFIRMDDPMYVSHQPGLVVAVPGGREAYLEAHARQFPGEAAGLRRLAGLHAQVHRELLAFPPKPRVADLLAMPRRFPALWRYRNATMNDVMAAELADPRARAVYATLWSWIGAPPSRASFLLWAAMMGAYVDGGAFYVRGGYQQLADAVAAGLASGGGELLLGSRVTRILARSRHVQGVELEGGQQVRAPVVIAAIDSRDTFGTLLGPGQVPARYLAKLQRMEVGYSLLALYAVTDLDVRALGARHDTTVTTSWDPDQAYAKAMAGELAEVLVLIPTLKDPALAPPGEHLVILQAITPAHQGQAAPGREFAGQMLALAEQVLPGLRQHLTYVHGTGGDTGAGHLLHLMGPYAGWASTPRQSGPRRLPLQTPITGLLLAGEWTQPGHGIWTVMNSGIRAARLVLGAPACAPVIPVNL
jgi:phytoene dehydrogenase-like protein